MGDGFMLAIAPKSKGGSKMPSDDDSADGENVDEMKKSAAEDILAALGAKDAGALADALGQFCDLHAEDGEKY